MKQTTLFAEFESQRLTAGARQSDPVTSHSAAETVEASGKAEADRAAIRSVVCGSPQIGVDGFPMHGWTAGEIAARLGDGWTNVRVSRRTIELLRSGRILRGAARICSVHGNSMSTWHSPE